MPTFPLIAAPETYRPNTIDMVNDGRAREYWLEVFEQHTPGMARRAAESQGGTDDAHHRARRFREHCLGFLQTIRRESAAHRDLSIISLCAMRQRLLAEHGFDDPYRTLKEEENIKALELLSGVLEELDRLEERDRPRTLIRNVFAGNIFDMGCSGTIELYESAGIGFHDTRERLPDRPWLVDDLDALARRLDGGEPHRKAVFFVDNAGADVVLGMIPLARFLLQRGAEVILTANSAPALNDVTFEELVCLIGRVSEIDRTIAEAHKDGRLRLVPSGNGMPVIDLKCVSDELAGAARGADLLVIEGMGRALETNYDTRFRCDTLKLAMVKEQDVADLLGGKLYDVVCRFEPAAAAVESYEDAVEWVEQR